MPIPVVCIGNVTLGGAGKTPTVIFLANYLKKNNINAHVVSRGYGGAFKDIVFVAAQRTAIGRYKGIYKDLQAHNLGSLVIKSLIQKTELKEDMIDEVILGQVLTGSCGQNPARQAAINSGIPKETLSLYLIVTSIKAPGKISEFEFCILTLSLKDLLLTSILLAKESTIPL